MVDIRKLKEEQIKLAKKVIISDSLKKIKTIGGVEQTFVNNKIISSMIVCDFKTLKEIEKSHAIVDEKISYIRGFLFYREGPAIMEAYNKLENKPDALIVNANGILHPRRIGMASHLGILLDIATIGVAKRLMLGEVKEKTIYVDKEARGYEFITKKHAKSLYISPGYKISLKTSSETIKKCIKYPHKLPEPLHLAHKYSKQLRKEILQK